MSYCSLEEAWGGKDNSKCSYVENKSDTKKTVSFNIQNENKCDEHFSNTRNNVELDNTLSCDNYYSFENNDDSSNNNQICNNYLNPPSGILNNANLSKSNNNNNYKPPNAIHNSILTNKTNNSAPMPSNNNDSLYQFINNDDSYQNNNVMYNDVNYNVEEENVEEDEDEDADEDADADADAEKVEESDKNNKVEGFHNPSHGNLDQKMLLEILDRLNAVENQINSISSNKKNNIHDMILYIIIGIFILFALDSIFRLGRLTV